MKKGWDFAADADSAVARVVGYPACDAIDVLRVEADHARTRDMEVPYDESEFEREFWEVYKGRRKCHFSDWILHGS